ncbi:MAG: hypothetical protein OEV79_09200 [candidate division WOR-3 bacterium]|nr:hypothetical protein [candidate division WOR-3 bacterium]
MKYLACLLIIFSLLSANGLEDYLADRIENVNEELLQSYIQPLVNAFGTGISTGLFQSAYSHDFLGFDIGLRLMSIHIPEASRYFDGIALACSLAMDSLVYYEIPLENLSTVFGPEQEIDLPISGNSIGIPTNIPTGFDISSAPLLVPQINVGLVFGTELAIRYVPFTFEGSRMNFFGIGVKQELNKFPLFKPIGIPIAIAIGAAYQRFNIENRDRKAIANTSTWNLQVLVSKRLGPLEPVIGVGIENTRAYFNYVFEYEIPDTINNIPAELITVEQEVTLHLESQSRYRSIVGCTLHLGHLYFHYDYNFTPYSTHNAIVGFSFR